MIRCSENLGGISKGFRWWWNQIMLFDDITYSGSEFQRALWAWVLEKVWKIDMKVLQKKEFDRQWYRVWKWCKFEQVANKVILGVAQNTKKGTVTSLAKQFPTSNECCSNGFGDWKRNIVTNTVKVMNTAGATCQRNMFSEIKITVKCYTKIAYSVWQCDAMIKDGHEEEISNFTWADVPIIMKSVLSALSLSLLFVMQLDISLRRSPSCVRERSMSALDKDMYCWMSSAYQWWSNLWQ